MSFAFFNNMTEQIFQPREMEEFEKDNKWFHENINSLRKKGLTGKFVAVANRNVIASDRDIEVVIKFIEKQGKNPAYVSIEFVYPEGTVVLF